MKSQMVNHSGSGHRRTDHGKGGNEIKKSREQLRKLSAHLELIREGERTKAAGEIHDDLGQALTALKMDLSMFRDKFPRNEKSQHKKINSMMELITSITNAVNRIATKLPPGTLDELGLAAAIEQHTDDFQKRTGLPCKVTFKPKEIDLNQNQSTTVYRIYQETLTNITNHAKATHVTVKLEEKAENIILTVKDNGRGITKEQASSSKSLGIVGIRERAYPWKGEVNIKGVKGKGTTVTVSIPLDKK